MLETLYCVTLVRHRRIPSTSTMQYCNFICVLCDICVCVIRQAISSNTPYTATAGMYITGGAQRYAIRTLEAVWSLHVVVGSPNKEFACFNKLLAFRRLLVILCWHVNLINRLRRHIFIVYISLISTWHLRWRLITDIVDD